jgi:alpha-galactosidase
VEVTLHYTSFAKENIIKTWTEIRHNEKKPVVISQYASSMLYFESSDYFLTEYSGDWAREVQRSSQQLQFGKKIIDTKLGSRAAMRPPVLPTGFRAGSAGKSRKRIGGDNWLDRQFPLHLRN